MRIIHTSIKESHPLMVKDRMLPVMGSRSNSSRPSVRPRPGYDNDNLLITRSIRS